MLIPYVHLLHCPQCHSLQSIHSLHSLQWDVVVCVVHDCRQKEYQQKLSSEKAKRLNSCAKASFCSDLPGLANVVFQRSCIPSSSSSMDFSYRESINSVRATAPIRFVDSQVVKQAFGRMGGSHSPKISRSCVNGLGQEASQPHMSEQADPHFLQAQVP